MAMGKLRRVSRVLETEGKALTVAKAREAFKALSHPSGAWDQMTMTLPAAQRSGKVVLRTHQLQVGYDAPLFTSDDITLYRGQCAALIGPNGSGKTTLMRTILGQLEPLAGAVRLGTGLQIGYFAQAHDTLNLDRTVIEEVRSYRDMTLTEVRNHLAQYLFCGEDVFKVVGGLSGGERGRLALAILALQGANFLLLDEPTNHLDVPAQEVLQEVLAHFTGTILLISHDRYLIGQLASQIWHLADGRLTVFRAGYRAFAIERTRETQITKVTFA